MDINETELRLLQQIIAHGSGTLSAEEIEYRNTDLTKSRIETHLCDLEDRGLVRKMSANTPSQDLPSRYWAVTEFGVDQLKQGGLYDEISIIAEADRALERTDRICEIEQWDGRPTV